ncbi:MAG: hypothetical protein PUC00_04750 [Clostridiales bacterium]|nr:hypothetical protein [Clostridiales bacterium]
MDDMQLALKYAPIIHFDLGETIPLKRVGYTVFREKARSDSFPKRTVKPEDYGLVIEYALFWDYDIQHMYDLEHIWVWVAPNGQVSKAEASFHGKYLMLWGPEMPFAKEPENTHVHAYCQPGKHAFLPDAALFRLIPGWQESCNVASGGEILVGGPFEGTYASTPEDDARCAAHIRAHLSFTPTLRFDAGKLLPAETLCTWEELKAWIPARIQALCAELREADR